jgi:hypothetical protein
VTLLDLYVINIYAGGNVQRYVLEYRPRVDIGAFARDLFTRLQRPDAVAVNAARAAARSEGVDLFMMAVVAFVLGVDAACAAFDWSCDVLQPYVALLVADSAADTLDINSFRRRPGPGRPSLLDERPELRGVLRDLYECGSIDRHLQAETLFRPTGLSLRRAVDAIQERAGVPVSISFVFRHLLPARAGTASAQRHHPLVLARPVLPQPMLTAAHEDEAFCAALVKRVKCFGLATGALVLCFDNKARIFTDAPAVAAAYRVWSSVGDRPVLPDHFWGALFQTSLNACAFLRLTLDTPTNASALPTERSLNGGQAFYGVSIAAQTPANAAQHLTELLRIFENYRSALLGSVTAPLPESLVIITDGGVDVGPKFAPSWAVAYLLQQLFGFKSVIWVTYAPGQSKYNPVERVHPQANRALSGVVLTSDDLPRSVQQCCQHLGVAQFSGLSVPAFACLPTDLPYFEDNLFMQYVRDKGYRGHPDFDNRRLVASPRLVALLRSYGRPQTEFLTFSEMRRYIEVHSLRTRYCLELRVPNGDAAQPARFFTVPMPTPCEADRYDDSERCFCLLDSHPSWHSDWFRPSRLIASVAARLRQADSDVVTKLARLMPGLSTARVREELTKSIGKRRRGRAEDLLDDDDLCVAVEAGLNE